MTEALSRVADVLGEALALSALRGAVVRDADPTAARRLDAVPWALVRRTNRLICAWPLAERECRRIDGVDDLEPGSN